MNRAKPSQERTATLLKGLPRDDVSVRHDGRNGGRRDVYTNSIAGYLSTTSITMQGGWKPRAVDKVGGGPSRKWRSVLAILAKRNKARAEMAHASMSMAGWKPEHTAPNLGTLRKYGFCRTSRGTIGRH